MPTENVSGREGESGQGKDFSLALHEAAKRLLDAFPLARVVFCADRAGLTTQFEAKDAVLQFIEAALHCAVEIGCGSGCARLSGCLGSIPIPELVRNGGCHGVRSDSRFLAGSRPGRIKFVATHAI